MSAATPHETIVAAAVRYHGLTISLPPPARHHDLIGTLWHQTGHVLTAEEQGFLTSAGHFADRKSAAMIAIASGQVQSLPHADLFSEDLW